MKAFEEWNEKYKKLKNLTKLDETEAVRYDTWRAALEWTKTQRSKGMEEDGSISVCDWVMIRTIEEELNS